MKSYCYSERYMCAPRASIALTAAYRLEFHRPSQLLVRSAMRVWCHGRAGKCTAIHGRYHMRVLHSCRCTEYEGWNDTIAEMSVQLERCQRHTVSQYN